MTCWYQMTADDVLEKLGTAPDRGLNDDRVAALRADHGANELVEMDRRGPGRILAEQFASALVALLVVAAAVSFLLQEHTDAIVILAIVVLNATLGFAQDYRAEKALAGLKKLAVPHVRVRRNGSVRKISARELVPGDVVLLEVGNYVPADCRLLETVNLSVQESALTGESAAVEKQTEAFTDGDRPLADRNNMAYMGTIITYGHGQGVVTATGMNTELGQIARSLQTVKREKTPLQKRLAELGRTLALIAIAIVALVFLLGFFSDEPTRLLTMTALSLAVAIVPEGLPAVATVALALGARRMFQRHALIRKLPAVETLGSVTVICSDKTGTLTENRMTVTVLDVAGQHLELATETVEPEATAEPPPDGQTETGSPNDGPRSQSSNVPRQPNEPDALRQQIADHESLALLLAGGTLCNDAELEKDEAADRFQAIGDPTEGALAVAAARLGLRKNRLATIFPRIAEVPFDSDRKRMTTVHLISAAASQQEDGPLTAALRPIIELDGEHIAFSKGAVDSLLEVCQYTWEDGEPKPLTDDRRQRIAEADEKLAAAGMRVLGVAFRPLDAEQQQIEGLSHSAAFAATDSDSSAEGIPADDVEQELIFIGMFGMIDPPRPEAASAVAHCRSAGIRPVMITGDHPLTARHIANQLKISDNGSVLTGKEIQQLDDAQLREAVETTSVYARVAPKHKLQLVQALQECGQVVAMTGDGVNDAPALKQAHIGVAMGITGTDVSKEASQMVLLDDNFATIVGAVEEGRIVYDNIRKFVKYTMTSNAGEVGVMVLGPLLGMPLPLLPLQILWINLVTDGLPGLALAVEKAERGTMQRPPHPPDEHIFGRGMARDIVWIGLLMAIVSLALGYVSWSFESAAESHWRTMIFTVLTLAQMGNAMAIRSDRESLFQIGVFSNRPLIGSVALTLVLQMGVIYWPPLQGIFKTAPLSGVELLMCVALSTLVFWAVECQKWAGRRRAESGVQSGRDDG